MVTRILLNALVLACLPMPVRMAMCFISNITVLRSNASIGSNALGSELLPIQLFKNSSRCDEFLSCEKNKTRMNFEAFKKTVNIINVTAAHISNSVVCKN